MRRNRPKNLRKGSRNHLRSFVSTIDANGGTYEPVLMDANTYDATIGTELETGSRNGRGR